MSPPTQMSFKSPTRPPKRSPSSSPPVPINRSPTSRGAGNELAEKLRKRAEKAESAGPLLNKSESKASSWAMDASAEFRDFTRDELEELASNFNAFDKDKNGTINVDELKKLLEKLGHPQTHAALKAMSKEVDEDKDGQISLREFIKIYKKSRKGEVNDYEDLKDLSTSTESVDVDKIGVFGAKSFFEAKASELNKNKEIEEEVKAKQAERRQAQLLAAQRKSEFREKMSAFGKKPEA